LNSNSRGTTVYEVDWFRKVSLMAWTAILKNVSIDRGNILPVVVFISDSGEEIVQDFRGDDITAERLARLVAQRIVSLGARDVAFTSLQSLVGQTVIPAHQTANELAASKFFSDLSRLNRLKVAVQKGFIKSTDQALIDLEASVKSAFKPEYINDFRFQ